MRYGLRLVILEATLLGCCAGGPEARSDIVPLATSATDALPSQLQGTDLDARAAPNSRIPDLATRMGEDAIRRQLGAWGIAGIRDWRREGTVFRAVAEWYGELVDLHVDAETGKIKQPERLKGTQIEWMLRRNGWGLVKEVKRGGDTFSVQAERSGRIFDLRIDAKTGQIQEAR